MSQRQIKAAKKAAARWKVNPATGLALAPQPHVEAAKIRYRREIQNWAHGFTRWARLQQQMAVVLAKADVSVDELGMYVARIIEPSVVGGPGKLLYEFKAETPEDLVTEGLLATGTGPVFRELPDGRTHVDRVQTADTVDAIATEAGTDG